MCELCGQPDWYCKSKYGFKQITNIKTGALKGEEFSKLLEKIMKQMSLREQEIYLVNQISELKEKEDRLRWMLAKVRAERR